jgi:hypothetical protein
VFDNISVPPHLLRDEADESLSPERRKYAMYRPQGVSDDYRPMRPNELGGAGIGGIGGGPAPDPVEEGPPPTSEEIQRFKRLMKACYPHLAAMHEEAATKYARDDDPAGFTADDLEHAMKFLKANPGCDFEPARRYALRQRGTE